MPIQNQAQPNQAPQAVQTQQGTILVDPLTLSEVSAQVASTGAGSAGALINRLPPNERLMLNSLDPAIAQALEQNMIANQFIGQNQAMGGLSALPPTTETAIQLGNGPAGMINQTQSLPSYQTQSLPSSPMLEQNPNPGISSAYSVAQQLYYANKITLPQYFSIIQNLMQESIQPTTATQAEQAEAIGYAAPLKRAQQAEVFA